MAKLSVQLWSLKDETEKDFKGTLEKVSKLGYDGVEFAGFGGIEAHEMKRLLDQYGLKASGAHIGLDALEKDLSGIIEYNKTIENKYIVCPYLSFESERDCAELHRRLADISLTLKENGMILGYHNHAHEFVTFGSQYANDIIVGDDEKVLYEVDVFWTAYADVDTVSYLKKLGHRCPLVHLKDMRIDADGSKKDITFGEGVLHHHDILVSALKHCNPEWLIIEWEAFGEENALKAVGDGLENLKGFLKDIEKS